MEQLQEALAKLNSMPEARGMRWVSAKEKLPKMYQSVHAEQNNLIGQLTVTDERFVQFSWFGGVHSYTVKSENLGSIRWLDEDATQEPVKQDELWNEVFAVFDKLFSSRHINSQTWDNGIKQELKSKFSLNAK